MSDNMDERDLQILKQEMEYCAEIGTFTVELGGSYEEYAGNIMAQRAIAMDILQVVELERRLPKDCRKSIGSVISWKDMRATRNRIELAYSRIDPKELWDIATRDIPVLYDALRAAYESSTSERNTQNKGPKRA